MKYKVGDKVKARRKYLFNKGEIVKITKVHERDRMYFCEGTNVHCWQPERDLEPLDITLEELKSYNAPQSFEDKLKLFKAGTHVLHTPTQEVYDKLMVELEKRGYVWTGSDKPTRFNEYCGDSICISYEPYMEIRFCNVNFHGKTEILTLTPEDFSTPQVITITSDGYHCVTAESNGVTAEALCNPTDKFSIHKGSHMALKRLLDNLEEKHKVTKEPEGFHVGDIVEVAECDFSFADDIKGIQGVITKKYSRGYDVRFPVKFCDQTIWGFYSSELKLVRKYNA